MKRTEMIAFIKANPFIPITHSLFDNSEYLYADEQGNVWDENGNMFEDWYSPYLHDGIRIRDDEAWLSGWEIKKGVKLCKYHLNIPKVGLCCEAYYKAKRNDGREWMHFPLCSEANCPLEHPELIEGAILKTKE